MGKLETILDPRDNRGKRHPLPFVLAAVSLAILTGRLSVPGIQRYIQNKIDRLRDITQRPQARPISRAQLPRILAVVDWPELNTAVVAAGKLVAQNCRDKGRPFYTVYHGGGEPTLFRERVESAQAALGAVAAACAAKPFRYVATNGVMSEEKAVWLARHFDLIGLSCDGPADIQNSQRPFWDGSSTSHILERTAHILREEGCRLHGRTTITPASLRRQAEIADYVCQQIAPEEVHFEPVYLGGRTSNRYHCVRECPDRCPLNGTTCQAGSEPGFRC